MRTAILTLAVALIGCATIVSGSHQDIVVSSNPSGAVFEVRNRNNIMVERGETPATIRVDRAKFPYWPQRYRVTMTRGLVERHSLHGTKVNGWYWGNLLFGGPFGLWILDPMTGAAFSFDELLHEDFEPHAPIEPTRSDATTSE